MLDYMNKIRQGINSSPYLAGVTMILLNIGSKYVEFGLLKLKKKLCAMD